MWQRVVYEVSKEIVTGSLCRFKCSAATVKLKPIKFQLQENGNS